MAKAGNKCLETAKKQKKDEFYTQLCDIERELRHYEQHFKGKTVFFNCDDPRISNFFHYFSHKFEDLGLKRLITTCYKNQERDLFSQNNCEQAIWLEYTGDKNGNRVPDPEEIGIKPLKGEPIRQDYLATVLKWKSGGDVKNYMALHQHAPSAMEEWLYFKGVIDWTQTLFPKYRKEMKGLEWGTLYNEFSGGKYDPAALECEIAALMEDDDVQKRSGIYEYLLSGRERERLLNIRTFTPGQKRAAYERQKGVCPKCKKHFAFEEMEGDHIKPWSKGGKTVPENLQMLCKRCNGMKSDR